MRHEAAKRSRSGARMKLQKDMLTALEVALGHERHEGLFGKKMRDFFFVDSPWQSP